MNKPDRWVVLKMSTQDSETIYKVFATWFGGYLDGDSWKINSGITDMREDEDYFYFIGFSGSKYACRKGAYGTNSYTHGVLTSIIDNAHKTNSSVEVMPEDTDWSSIF